MKQNISPGAFIAIIAAVVIILGGSVFWFFTRPAAVAGGSRVENDDTSQGGGGVRSHPNETMEQRRARIMAEHPPPRSRRGQDRE